MSTNRQRWYEVVSGDELFQGDIFEQCPVFTPPDSLDPENLLEPPEFQVETKNLIILSQSCDLV